VPEQPDPDEAREDEAAAGDVELASPGSPAPTGGASVVSMDASVVEAFGQRARLAEDRLAEVLAAYRQIKTDQEGVRERTKRALERRFEQRHEHLLVKFIDILDGFDRALEAAEQTYTGAPLIEGLILVRTQLLQTLRDEGLERIPVLGLPFDPHVSEAMATAAVDDSDQHHIVVKEYQRGYRFNGRLVRPSRVVVGEYSQAADPATRAAEAGAGPATAPVTGHDETSQPVPDGSGAGAPERQAPLVVTPLIEEEDGAPTLEEIVARAEIANGQKREESPEQA
jgi:molecular chaperone GrpE